jgi:uncharacterized protein (TIGR03083 family)
VTAQGSEPLLLPDGLRARVLDASRQARTAGRATPEVPEISADAAFSRAADALYGLLNALSDNDWRTTTIRGLSVQGLMGHLIGVEQDVHRALSGDPAIVDVNHVESTQWAAEHEARRRPSETRSDWRRAVDHTLEVIRAGADLDAEVAVHGLRMPLSQLLTVRAFELWTHENDVRDAVGLRRSVPDASTLQLMTKLAARLVPYAVSRDGFDQALDLHLVLTGPGGGTWDLMIGGGRLQIGAARPARMRIVTDAVGFCRLAANRVRPDDLQVHVSGDGEQPDSVAERVLVAVSTLALD